MRFPYIEVPGYCKMAIHMQYIAVFNDTEIMQVNPVYAPVGIKQRYHSLQQYPVGFIHYTGNRASHYAVAGINNEERESCGYRTVYPLQAGKQYERQSCYNAQCRPCIALQVFTAGNQSGRIVLFSCFYAIVTGY